MWMEIEMADLVLLQINPAIKKSPTLDHKKANEKGKWVNIFINTVMQVTKISIL